MSDLSRIRVDRAPAPRLRRVLLLEGVAPEGEPKAAAALEAAQVPVRRTEGAGYEEMLDSAHLSRFPEASAALVGEWLAAERAATDAPDRAVPETFDELVLDVNGVRIRERRFTIATDAGTMFGILAEPADGALAAPDLCLVGLPAMAERCIGPGRLWVELARHWAARGLPMLRVDLPAVGDSDGDRSAMRNLRTVFNRERITQVRQVLDALQAATPARRFTLAGLCSGGYWALNTAWVDDRVDGLLVLNPSVSAHGHAQIMRDAASRPLRMVLRPATWRRLLSGEASLRGGLDAALRGARFMLRGDERVGPEPLPEESSPSLAPPEVTETGADLAPSYRALIERMGDRGGRVAFGACRIEPGHRLLEIEGLRAHPEQWPGLTIMTFGSDDHDLRPLADQRDVHRLAETLLSSELAHTTPPARLPETDGAAAGLTA